jgi:hypothetical protein
MKLKLLLTVLISTTLTACASMSVDECKVANWHEVGFNDASKGYDKHRFEKHSKACQKAGITPNFDTYTKGYEDGLRIYCTPQNIFELGLDGRGDYKICPSSEHSLLKPYHDVSNSYYQAKKDRKQLLDDIQRYQLLLNGKDLKKETKESYQRSLSLLENKRFRITQDFYDAEDKMERFRRAKNLNAW